MPPALEGSNPIGPLVAIRPIGMGSCPARADGSGATRRVGRVVWPGSALLHPAKRTNAVESKAARDLIVADPPRAVLRCTIRCSVRGRILFVGDRSTRNAPDVYAAGRPPRAVLRPAERPLLLRHQRRIKPEQLHGRRARQ